MSSDRLFAVFGKIVLVLVILAAVSAIAFYLGSKSKQEQASQTYAQPTIIPTTIPSVVTPSENLTPAPTADETSQIKAEIKNDLVAEHGSDANSLVVTVSKVEGDYAMGDASAQGGGGLWYAAKAAGGSWKLVWDGNGEILCSTVASYPNFPTDMMPQCWDDKTMNPVKR